MRSKKFYSGWRNGRRESGHFFNTISRLKAKENLRTIKFFIIIINLSKFLLKRLGWFIDKSAKGTSLLDMTKQIFEAKTANSAAKSR